MRQTATFRRALANGAPPLGSPAAGYAPRRAWTVADLQTGGRTPTTEWLESLARDGRYRISYSVNRKRWYVVDILPEDSPNVAGPFKSRESALARAGILRDASADTLTGSDIARALDARALDSIR